MAFKTLQELTGVEAKRGNHSKIPSDQILFATDKRSKGDKGSLFCMRIGIPVKTAKKARFVAGDKVEVLFDVADRVGLVRRVSSGGYTLCKHHENSRLTVKATYYPGMPTVSDSVGCLSDVTDDGIVFMLPDSVSFEKNLRA